MHLMYKSIPDVVPEGSVGLARLEHFEVRDGFAAWCEGVSPGRYARLYVNGQLYMTDTRMERHSNYDFVHNANGHVLIAGLGIGLILTATLDKPEVISATVVEKFQDVISLVAPHHRHPKLTAICADIFAWKPERGFKYDTIYFDIWPDICADNLDEMATLHRRFAKNLNRDNPRAWMGSWQQGYLRSIKRREKRRPW